MNYTLTTTATKLSSLIDPENPYQKFLILQSSKANTDDILFGPIGDSNHFLEIGESVTLPLHSLATIEVRAKSATQILTITRG